MVFVNELQNMESSAKLTLSAPVFTDGTTVCYAVRKTRTLITHKV